ncbi:hypothetical protein CROQUDRAFT_662424 [Cronartium quercuum f. sp. fusiforme G11]|uniref:Uncharacterized protein n=1 Tax=Cronartium quercuum f. sp. fusiforme G11 TaxID=708437 RepID=A0A9P6NAD1_9BASI|nr:hypothetical protein CROQUDRAFT_662424 [Cronartium quercuum f. sp. fusiforme G11]
MRSHSLKLLIILQALLFGTVIRAGSNRSVDPLIERLSVQKLEPLGWLTRSRREDEEKFRERLPASSGLVKSYHNSEGKHKAYKSLQARAPSEKKLVRVNKRAAPFTEQQLHQLNQEQSAFSPSQPNSIADDHEKWKTASSGSSNEKMSDFFDSSGESWSKTSFTQQDAQDDKLQVLPVPNLSSQADIEVESYDELPESDLSLAEGTIEALDQEAHYINTLVNSLVFNVSLEGSHDFFKN